MKEDVHIELVENGFILRTGGSFGHPEMMQGMSVCGTFVFETLESLFEFVREYYEKE